MLYLFTLHRPYVTRGLLTVSLNNFLIPSSCYFTQQALEESYKNVSHDARDNSVKCHLSSLPYSICFDHITPVNKYHRISLIICFNSQIFVAKKV